MTDYIPSAAISFSGYIRRLSDAIGLGNAYDRRSFPIHFAVAIAEAHRDGVAVDTLAESLRSEAASWSETGSCTAEFVIGAYPVEAVQRAVLVELTVSEESSAGGTAIVRATSRALRGRITSWSVVLDFDSNSRSRVSAVRCIGFRL